MPATATRPVPTREWLTLKEAAEWCGMHPDTLAEAARVPGTPIRRKKRHDRGSKHVYSVASLRAWIETWEDA